MKICFVLNDVENEDPGTSVIILRKAHQRGHEIYVMGVADFVFYRDRGVLLRCKKISKSNPDGSVHEFWDAVKEKASEREVIPCTEMDIVFLRNNPTEEAASRSWAEHSGIAFGQMIKKQGVLVINDPAGLSQAFIDKLYFEELPAKIKPNSLITRNKDEILQFWEENNKEIVLKPLEGSRGKDVYKIGKEKRNLSQILNTLTDQGYVIAQEYLPEVKNGDVRVLMLNGKILEQDGELGIIRRLNKDKSEFRSNLVLGATPSRGKLTPEIKHIASVVGPKLIEDGLFFVGLDIVEDKLIEINVLSPGDMHYTDITGMTDFTTSIVKSLERKAAYRAKQKNFSNRELATMNFPDIPEESKSPKTENENLTV